MIREVIRVSPGTGFREIVALLDEYDISAAPVADAGNRPIGIVSEADLMRTQAAQDDPGEVLAGPSPSDVGPATAGELMSSPAVCTTRDASVVAAAGLMARHGVKRLPVARLGRGSWPPPQPAGPAVVSPLRR